MNEQILISVMVPVFNGKAELPLSLKTLLNQTYSNWECIIVNDGSTDGTRSYLDSLKDKRFRVFHFEKNKGRPAARQKALDEAKGDFLVMLDADDWYYPTKLENQLSVIRTNNDIVLISSAMVLTNESYNAITCQTHTITEGLGYNSSIPHAPSMIRMSEAKKHGYDLSLPLGEDHDFMMKVLKGNKFLYDSNPTYVYNVGSSFKMSKYIYTLWLGVTTGKITLKEKFISLIKIPIGFLIFTLGQSDRLLAKRGVGLTEAQQKEFHQLRINTL